MAEKLITGKERPIGVFDSGVGGLSVLRALERRLPGENYIYFGDTARAPYGNRSAEEIRRFNKEIGSWLLEQGCKMLLVACNTSTVLGMEVIKAMAAIPVFGMMEATLAGSLSAEEDSVWPIGFIATKGTVESGAYQKAFGGIAQDKLFYAQACPEFVPYVEKGDIDGQEVMQAVRTYLAPLREAGIRTLILGCTHYPFLASAISSFLGPGIRLVDPALALADMVEASLKGEGLLNDGLGGAGNRRMFYCSGDKESFRLVGGALYGCPMGEVRRKVF